VAHYGLTRDDTFFCTVPLHFDFSLADFFTPAMVGACTELVPEPALLFPASLAALLEQSRATIWSSVPYTFTQLCERGAVAGRDLSSLRWLIYGGEPMPPSALPLLRQTFSAQISNSYGPAEVNQVTEYTVPEDHPADRAIPLGGPMPHAALTLAEDGELLVAAPSMMRGYWNRPDLDAVPSPISVAAATTVRRPRSRDADVSGPSVRETAVSFGYDRADESRCLRHARVERRDLAQTRQLLSRT
jgi:Acyl-CoA synthetases (AMP-forming)/AMP-acid ligases II